MQLRNARLCLDCEELHDEQRCPVCASDAYAFITKWVPVGERRRSPRARRRAPEAPPPSGVVRWLEHGVAGVALFAAGRWLWRATRPDASPPSSGAPDDPR